jgi:hypothetical protein
MLRKVPMILVAALLVAVLILLRLRSGEPDVHAVEFAPLQESSPSEPIVQPAVASENRVEAQAVLYKMPEPVPTEEPVALKVQAREPLAKIPLEEYVEKHLAEAIVAGAEGILLTDRALQRGPRNRMRPMRECFLALWPTLHERIASGEVRVDSKTGQYTGGSIIFGTNSDCPPGSEEFSVNIGATGLMSLHFDPRVPEVKR